MTEGNGYDFMIIREKCHPLLHSKKRIHDGRDDNEREKFKIRLSTAASLISPFESMNERGESCVNSTCQELFSSLASFDRWLIADFNLGPLQHIS